MWLPRRVDRDPSVGGAAPNVKALLGTIGHRLCERSALGLLGGPDAEWDARFDLAWLEELERAAQRYPELGEPARWGWPQPAEGLVAEQGA